MGGCQNYGPFLGPWYNTAPSLYGTQNGTLILTTTHVKTRVSAPFVGARQNEPLRCAWTAVSHGEGKLATKRSASGFIWSTYIGTYLLVYIYICIYTYDVVYIHICIYFNTYLYIYIYIFCEFVSCIVLSRYLLQHLATWIPYSRRHWFVARAAAIEFHGFLDDQGVPYGLPNALNG